MTSLPRRASRAVAALFLPALAAAAVAVAPCRAAAQDVEEILSFDAEIDVRPGGSMSVTEVIVVRALGDRIRRGIFRDVPTSFPRSLGLGRIEAPFEPEEVLRDGAPEPFALEAIGGPSGRGGVRVRIGDPDATLSPGLHTYTIRYRTDRWVHFGGESDVVYWNVTGNGWELPIRSASARVRIAELSGPPTLEAWTGPEGSTLSQAEHAWNPSAREATFATTAAMGVGEGLTVRLTFPSGQLTPPTEEQTRAWFGLDWSGYVEAGYLVLLVIGTYVLMWRRVGVDPGAPPTRLRSEPPPGFSPAALGFLEERGYAPRHLAAALVNLAVQGAVRIERDGASWTVHAVDRPEGGPSENLALEEQVLLRRLLGRRNSIRLSQSQHETLRGAAQAFRRRLSARLENHYFQNNRGWFAFGAAASLLGFAVLAWRWRWGIGPQATFLGLWLTAWTAGVSTLGYRLVRAVRFAARGGGPVAWIGVLLLGGFAAPFFIAEIAAATMLVSMVPAHLVLAAVAVGGTNVLFYHLLERPTLRGQGVLDHLDGFKAYLSGRAGPAPHGGGGGGEAFERYLPHAIALGLEGPWADGFSDALRDAGRPEATRALPWFDHDGPTGSFDAPAFASSLGYGLASTLSSASRAPSGDVGSSGSGFSGGGGSSGGGGGGGGGGGW